MGILESISRPFFTIRDRLTADRNKNRTPQAAKEPELVIAQEDEWVIKNVGNGPAKRVLVSIGQFDPNYKPGTPIEFVAYEPIAFDKILAKDGPIPLTVWLDNDRNVIRGIGRFGVTYENADGSEKRAFVMQGDETIEEKPENIIFTKEPVSYKDRIKRLQQLRIV